MADEQSSPDDRAPTDSPKGQVVNHPSADVKSARTGGGFFTIYKHGQGYWTRMGTAIAAALISLLTANFVYQRLVALKAVYRWHFGAGTMIAISAAVFALLMLWAWRLMNKPTNVD